jgi:DNA-binding response OmpR family regulator
MRLLLVEDDISLQQALHKQLILQQKSVDLAIYGQEA